MQIHDDFLKDQTAADEFVDWWLWQKAHVALRIQFNKPSFSLTDCVREIRDLRLAMIPIVVAKAEHILGLCDGDNEAYEFVHGYDRSGVAEDNPYFIRYRRDRFSVSTTHKLQEEHNTLTLSDMKVSPRKGLFHLVRVPVSEGSHQTCYGVFQKEVSSKEELVRSTDKGELVGKFQDRYEAMDKIHELAKPYGEFAIFE